MVPTLVADLDGAGRGRGRAGADEVDDPRDAVVDGLDEAVREHHQQVAGEALLREAAGQRAQVALDDRADVGRHERSC